MFRQTILLPLALLIALSATVVSDAQVNTYRTCSFGDSLSDNENLYLLFGNDPSLYGADPTEAVFDKASRPGDELQNFAVLGSTTDDVLAQISAYVDLRLNGQMERSTLISLQAGGNDVLNNLEALASAPPGTSAAVDSLVRRIQRNLVASYVILRSVDRAQMIVWTIPDVTLIPLVQGQGLPDVALANIRAHVESINRVLRLLGRLRRSVCLDLYQVNQSVATNPPVIAGVVLIPPPFFGLSVALFADPIHPTAVGNALIANELIANLNGRFDDTIALYSEAELATLAGLSP